MYTYHIGCITVWMEYSYLIPGTSEIIAAARLGPFFFHHWVFHWNWFRLDHYNTEDKTLRR